MKTSIMITGSGLNSKTTLKNAIMTFDCDLNRLNFNNFEIVFNTKKEAVNALSEAYKHLSHDKEDWKASCGSYTRGRSLSYDAGIASIASGNY